MLVTEKLLEWKLLEAKRVPLGSWCLSITSSIADLTLALFSVTRGVEAAGFPQESRVVGGNECEFLAFFFLLGIVHMVSIFHSSSLGSGHLGHTGRDLVF